MSAFKKGQKADGKYSQAVPLTPAKGDNPQGVEKGKDLSKIIYGDPDRPAVRGGSEGRDKKGT